MTTQNDEKHKWQYGKPPYYINFPVSFFSYLTGNSLDVQQFKRIMDDILVYGTANEYRRMCSAWHDPKAYDENVMHQVEMEMGITVDNRRGYFNDYLLPMMDRVVQGAGHAFCGIDKAFIFSYRDEDKSASECVQLLAYCAIRSILGRSLMMDTWKMPRRIVWAHILSRMAGNTALKVPVDSLPPFIVYYNTRRHHAALKKLLVNRWHVQVDGRRGPGGAYYMISDTDTVTIADALKTRKVLNELKRERAKRPKNDGVPHK